MILLPSLGAGFILSMDKNTPLAKVRGAGLFVGFSVIFLEIIMGLLFNLKSHLVQFVDYQRVGGGLLVYQVGLDRLSLVFSFFLGAAFPAFLFLCSLTFKKSLRTLTAALLFAQSAAFGLICSLSFLNQFIFLQLLLLVGFFLMAELQSSLQKDRAFGFGISSFLFCSCLMFLIVDRQESLSPGQACWVLYLSCLALVPFFPFSEVWLKNFSVFPPLLRGGGGALFLILGFYFVVRSSCLMPAGENFLLGQPFKAMALISSGNCLLQLYHGKSIGEKLLFFFLFLFFLLLSGYLFLPLHWAPALTVLILFGGVLLVFVLTVFGMLKDRIETDGLNEIKGLFQIAPWISLSFFFSLLLCAVAAVGACAWLMGRLGVLGASPSSLAAFFLSFLAVSTTSFYLLHAFSASLADKPSSTLIWGVRDLRPPERVVVCSLGTGFVFLLLLCPWVEKFLAPFFECAG